MQLRRNIFHQYPVRLLPLDLACDFPVDASVTVTIETEGEFPIGSPGIEWILEYRDGQVVQLIEREFRK